MIKHFEELESTSTYIKEHVHELNSFDIVSTNHQTKGRGRTGHDWEDTVGQNVLMSILIKDKELIDSFNVLSVATGVIVLNYLKNYLPPKEISLKWPNDVYVKGKKICGILLEGKLPDYVIIGIGLNINQKHFSVDNATSLSIETEYDFNIDNVRGLFFDHLLSELHNFSKNKERYIKEFNHYNYLKNKTISFNRDNEQIHAVGGDINPDGSLSISIDGNIENVFFDEVSLVR